MKTKEIERNLFLYRLYIMFNEPLLWGPILVDALQKLAGMDLPSIYFMESAIIVLCVLVDIPTGALADIIGRKKILVIARIFLLLSFGGFTFMTSPLMVWVANILWAVGYAFQSGADSSLLYETLKEAGREEEYKKIEGRTAGWRWFLIAICCLPVGFLAKIDIRLPLYISLFFVCIPLLVSLFFKEPRHEGGGCEYSLSIQWEIMKKGFLHVWRSPEIRWAISLSILLGGVSKIWFFTYNPYFERVEMDIALYGIIFFLLNGVAWLSSRYLHEIEKVFKEKGVAVLMILSVGIPVMIMGLIPAWPCAFLVLFQNVTRGINGPFLGEFIHRHADSSVRSTILSVRSTCSALAGIFSLVAFGLLSRQVDLLHSLVILGIVTLGIGIIIIRDYGRIFPKRTA